jgi:Fe-S-cluster containining protein
MPGDCCECGACCFSNSDTYVQVQEEESQALEKAQAYVKRDGALYLRMHQGHCAQLAHADGDWVCQVYPDRPSTCRQLKRGSPECLEERHLKLALAKKLSVRLRQTENPL